jgi:2-oxo-3-hexenedioate decarboxylase
MTVADGGLHSHLLVGKKVEVKTVAKSAQAFNGIFAGCQVALHKNASLLEHGRGCNVLDGPLLALQYFLTELRQCPNAPDVMPADVITTGTWTDAWPVQAGEVWRAAFDAPLTALTVTFT